MQVFSTIAPLRDLVRDEKKRSKTVAFVPTMGALHEGHGSCVKIGRQLGDLLVASIFRNPTQFGPGEDLARYPVALDSDLEKCKAWGCDVVFVPSVDVIYPVEQSVWVIAERISEPLCGRTREGHFRGVATVVVKLFNIVEPDVAVFGQKDAQQALVIREMTRQLNLPVEIRLSPLVREADGLAYSSRNAYLSDEERRRAVGIYEALGCGRDRLAAGETSPQAVCLAVREHMEQGGIEDIEYVELLNAQDLTTIEPVSGQIILAVAARVGKTRLIDNLVLRVAEGGHVEDVLLF